MKGATRNVKKDLALKGELTRFLDSWFAVRQYIQATNFNRFQGAGLSATQFMTLNLLPSGGEGIAIGELARRMNLKPATVAKTVDSLEARNLIARVRAAPDKRVVHIQITRAGEDLQNLANGSFRAQIAAVFAAMPAAERSGLILGLESLIRAASPHNQPAAPNLRPVPRVGPGGAQQVSRSSRQSQPK